MNIGQNLKIQINANLQSLTNSHVLASFISQDSGKDPLTIDAPGGYPFAIVSMPQISSVFEDTNKNLRTYRWDIMFLTKTDDLNDGDLENLIDLILAQFDNNFTLSGVADGSVSPAEVLSWPASSADKTYSCFVITLRAKALFTINQNSFYAGGSLGGFIDAEQVAGTDGYHWTLAENPINGSVHLFANGPRIFQGTDYTISGQTITTTAQWPVESIFADYRF